MSTSSSAEAPAPTPAPTPAPVPARAADHFRPDLFAGHRVLVTGGTSGIGAAIAEAFLSLGASVVATGLTDADLARSHDDGALARAHLVQLDLRDRHAVDALIGDQPALDHVVNCAGTIRRHAELEPEVFADVLDVNLTGTMRVCAAARPKLAGRGGTIVNTASMLAFFGGGAVPAYSASKGGIAQLTRSLAIAYADEGIRVNAVAPGWIATALTAGLRDDSGRNAQIVGRTPMKRWGHASELAGAALFLSSPLASFVTGSILAVDGGYMSA